MSQKINLIGRIGKDAIVRTSQSGNKFVSFSLAVNQRVPNGEDTTVWYDIISFESKHTTNLVNFLKKGSLVQVLGDLDPKIGSDKNGKHYLNLTCRAFDIAFISAGGKKDDNNTTTKTAPTSENAPDEIPDDYPSSDNEEVDDLPF